MDKRTIGLIIVNILLIAVLLVAKDRKKLRNFVLLITTTILMLSVTEFVYRLFIQKHKYFTGDLADYFKQDSSLGYIIKKAGNSIAIKMDGNDTVFVKTYSVIADSTQPRIDFNHRIGFQHPDSAREIVFLGCSVTFGVGLDDTACMAYKTGQHTLSNTVNLGIQGYGTNQVYQLFRKKFADVPNTNRVFVYSFIYDHILRANGVYDWSAAGPFFKIHADSLIHSGSLLMNVEKHNPKYIHYLSGLGTFSFLRKMLSNVDTRRRVDNLQQKDFDRCFMMIRTMVEIAERSGGQFLLLDWGGNQWNDNMIDEQLMADFKKKLDGLTNLRIIKVSSVMDLNDPQHILPDDGHPSALANEKLAFALSSVL
ncbi:hypothetical protein [Pseudoflavitalea rhizosphaerae]|uniref:hypothetical protein n=1 Tax=Pseudoflavitalea rhizosphaerae TaxID=1884793 RepID=UPI000F8D774E|nr:hypothetical protein [Pseudoflavitalea rhizosphaerae]